MPDGPQLTPTITIEWIRSILIKELDLNPDQVNFYNQKWNVPPDERLYITIGLQGRKIFGNDSYVENREGDGYYEIKTSNIQDLISIDVFSRGPAALFRSPEVLHALVSQHSQQTQEKYSFKIATVPPSFTDLSEEMGAAILYRYQIIMPVLSVLKSEKKVDYYDQFTGRVITETDEVEFVQQTQE